MPAQITPEPLRSLCREMDAEVHALVAAQSAGRLDCDGFVQRLLRFEAERARVHGLTLSASHTFDDWTVLSLHVQGAADPCASFEFQPETGHFRMVGAACREPDPQQASLVW